MAADFHGIVAIHMVYQLVMPVCAGFETRFAVFVERSQTENDWSGYVPSKRHSKRLQYFGNNFNGYSGTLASSNQKATMKVKTITVTALLCLDMKTRRTS